MLWSARKPTTTTARVYARAALVGNPSDGYGGRTIAFTFRELFADVTVKPAPRLMIEAERGEGALLRAAYGRFAAHCIDIGATPAPCALSVKSSIPPAVGLAGSSAIVIGALRALASFNDVDIAPVHLPTVALAAEDDLDIPAGLQDRVTQVWEGLVYMDFDPRLLADDGHGSYVRLDPDLLEHAYVAWRASASVSSAHFHGHLRRRFRSGDAEVMSTLVEMADLAETARTRIEQADLDGASALVDANFDLRRRLGPLEPAHVAMVETARTAGASANYAGSGGAICGFVRGARERARLTEALSAIGCTVVQPTIQAESETAQSA
jgi:glucuronokinase